VKSEIQFDHLVFRIQFSPKYFLTKIWFKEEKYGMLKPENMGHWRKVL
jgi:hypothetical protein